MLTPHTVFFSSLPPEEEPEGVYLPLEEVTELSRSACAELSRSRELEGVCLPLEVVTIPETLVVEHCQSACTELFRLAYPCPLRRSRSLRLSKWRLSKWSIVEVLVLSLVEVGSWRRFLSPWSLSLSKRRGSWRGFLSPLRGSWRGCKTYINQNSSAFLRVPVYEPTYPFHQQPGLTCTTLPQFVLTYTSLSINSTHHNSLSVSIESPLLRRGAGVRPMPGLRLQHQQDVFLSTPKIILPACNAGRTVAARDSVVLLLRTAQRGKPRNSAFLFLHTDCNLNLYDSMARKKSTSPDLNYTHIIRTRVTEKTYRKLEAMVGNSNCHSIGEVARKILSRDRIVTYMQDNTLDNFMEQLILLRRELNAIGNNINQVTHQVHLAQNPDQKDATVAGMLPQLKIVEGRLTEAVNLIQQLGQKWLQK